MSNNVKFTEDQQLAFMKDRHLAVTANAGSGKTSVLVEKYLDLLMSSNYKKSSEAIRSIIAITFTRQAASDMKAKITKKISNKILSQSLSPKELNRLKSLRENISAAKVSTIHSFCNTLLKDYPIEAGISPAFREMDEYEANTAINLAVDTILEELTEKLINAENDDVLNEEINLYGKLLDSTGIVNLRDMIIMMLKDIVQFNVYSEFYKQDTKFLTKHYNNLLYINLINLLNSYFEIFTNEILKVEENIKNYQTAFDLIKSIENDLNTFPVDLASIYPKLKEFRDIKTVKNKLFYKMLITNIYDYETVESPNLTKNFETMLTDINDYINSIDYTEEYLEMVKYFISLVERCNVILWEEKNEQSAYTFDDLLILANNLLSKQEVRDIIISGIDYLMVDEFQDTNNIQYQIVKNLIPGLQNPDLGKSPKLFIVGDAKQSIYGFRSADVAVFNLAKKDISESNQIAINKGYLNINPNLNKQSNNINNSTSLGNISLKDTFRLLPSIALFVNKVCGNLFDEKKSGIKYEPLVCGRKLLENVLEDSILKPELGTVKFLFSVKSQDKTNQKITEIDDKDKKVENDEADRENEKIKEISEAELVCNYIKQIVYGQTDIKTYRNGEYVNPEFKDIAILTRKKNSIQKLRGALIESKINFSVVSGKGFYQTQEIMDLISLLNFLLNQNDDISLAGILKSPYFNLSDSELLNIGVCEGNTFYEKYLKYKPINPQSVYFYERSKSILNHLIELSGRCSISELLITTIEITDYYASIEKFDAKPQIKSNIRLFIQSARDFESKGYKSLYEFMLRVNQLQNNSEEAEAAFISGENVVSVMTVHASKGLEFPIVILFDSNFSNKNNSGLIKSKSLGISIPFKIQNKNFSDNRTSLEKITTIPMKMINKNVNELNLYEEARLLYVALTRAADHLVISSSLKATKSGFTINQGSFLSLIINSLQFDAVELVQSKQLLISGSLKFTGMENLNLKLFCDNISQNAMNKTVDSTSVNKSKEVNQTDNFLQNVLIEPENRYDIVSATKLINFKNDFSDFIDKYVLGLPEIRKYVDKSNYLNEKYEEELPDVFDNTEINYSGATYGTIFHQIFEKINLWLSDTLNDKFDKLNKIISNTLNDNYQFDNEILKNRIFDEVISVAKSDIIKNNLEHFRSSEFEKTLNMPLAGSLLTGNIDLLLKNEDNSIIEIWDWKTNLIKNNDDIIYYTNHYKEQIKFYIYLISKLYPDLDVYKGKLLFTNYSKKGNWVSEIHLNKSEVELFEQELLENISNVKMF